MVLVGKSKGSVLTSVLSGSYTTYWFGNFVSRTLTSDSVHCTAVLDIEGMREGLEVEVEQ